MSALEKAAAPEKEKVIVKGDSSSSSNLLEKRQSQELVLGFMGAVGCGLPAVITKCESLLKGLGYVVVRIKLSDFIRDHWIKTQSYVSEENKEARYLTYQTGGNALRLRYGTEIHAEYAINRIQRHRLSVDGETSDMSKGVPQIAYLIDQIKHPDEAKLLRLVYRGLFYLIGVMSTGEHRKSRLIDEGWEVDAEKIMRRDRKESEEYGQQLEKAFKLADYFVQHPLGDGNYLENELDRFLKLVHGHNGITPTKHEHAMYVAHSTALKSGCLSRQVGAAITDEKGKLIAVGANDVPKYGGGLYDADSGVEKDKRCFSHGGKCENVEQKSLRKHRIQEGLEAIVKSLPSGREQDFLAEKLAEILEVAYKSSGLPDLIEFSRAVHAEMDAIVSVARGGGGSTVGASLYTTTFPCHNCARHIIAAGIERVYYIEPYDKSLALQSHKDAIVMLDHEGDQAGVGQEKVKFIHFAGVAPNMYSTLFLRAGGRKGAGGSVVAYANLDGDAPRKIVKEFLDSYRVFETKVSSIFDENFPPGQGQEKGLKAVS